MTPNSPPSALAACAADAIRDLSRTTQNGGYRQPSDVYDTLGQLAQLIYHLPEALRGAEHWLNVEMSLGRVADDRSGRKVEATVEQASEALTAARTDAIRLMVRLEVAYAALSHLAGPPG